MDNETLLSIIELDDTSDQSKAVEDLREISRNGNLPFDKLFVVLGTNCLLRSHPSNLKFLLYLDCLSMSEKYDVLIISTNNASSLFFEMVDSLGDGEFFDYVNEKVDDQSLFCQTIQSSWVGNKTWFFSQLDKSINLWRLLVNNSEKIPQTLEHILQVAIELKSYDVVIQLSACFPKKRILGILINHGDYISINKFFSLYKDYPEIKNLTAFI